MYNSLVLAATTLVLVYFGLSFKKRRNLTPGPPSLPIIGNLYHIQPKNPWLKFTEWGLEYGSVVRLHGLGQNIIVLNTMKAVQDLLDGRGKVYSDRPIFPMVGQMMGLDQNVSLMDYTPEWTSHRKSARLALSPDSARKYRGTQESLAVLFSQLMLQHPKDFEAHARLTAGRVIMLLTYGLSVDTADNDYIKSAEETMTMISQYTLPGSNIVDIFPALRYIPSWIPLPFHRTAADGKKMIYDFITRPFDVVKANKASGSAKPSLTRDLLDQTGDGLSEKDHEEKVKWISGALYGAGAETTYTTVLVFLYLMAKNPDKQRKAQAEIDQIVQDRMPLIQDREDLPYVNACIRETMRWHPALPFSIARRTAADDEYLGYFIPKGTVVLPNVWAISTQEIGPYPPKSFVPERFLEGHDIVDSFDYVFGFGRRVCPGRLIGENSVFILIASILSLFDISLPVDENGVEVDVVPTFSTGLVSYPKPYQCTIKPRSQAKASLIEDAAALVDI